MSENEIRAQAVREAAAYLDRVTRAGLVSKRGVLDDLGAVAYRMERGMTARGSTRPAALAEQGEPEWEYGATNVFDDSPVTISDTLAGGRKAQEFYTRERGRDTNLFMRTKAVPAGPWLPVPDTTNHESEEQP